MTEDTALRKTVEYVCANSRYEQDFKDFLIEVQRVHTKERRGYLNSLQRDRAIRDFAAKRGWDDYRVLRMFERGAKITDRLLSAGKVNRV